MTLFPLGAIPPPPITELHLGPLTVTVFGLVVAVALVAGVSVTRRRYEAVGGDAEVAEGVLLGAVVAGFVGARGAWVLTNLGRFEGRWIEVFAVWRGGLSFFGGLTVGLLTGVLLARRRGADLGGLAGAAAVGIPLAQAMGRPADYFSQELYGTPSTLPWAVEVPPSRRPAAFADSVAFHPAFFYEAAWSVATVGLILVLERRGVLRRGQLLVAYLLVYGVGRFLLELLRTDTTFRLLGLSRNGWVSLALVIGGALTLLTWRRRERRVAAGGPLRASKASVGSPARGGDEVA